METLTDRDRAILDLEKRPFTRNGSKNRAVREELGLTWTRYHQILNTLADTEAALAYAPTQINRIRRLRLGDGRRR